MRLILPLTTAAFALTFTMGCQPGNADPDADRFASQLPDSRILVAMPVNSGNRAVGDLAESYVTTSQVTSDVNGMISSVLDTVDHITDFEPSYSSDDDEYFWGPWNDGGLDPNETGLWVAYDAAADTYGWAIIQRPKTSTSDDDWIPVVAGESVPGATDETGDGFFIVDFDAIASLNLASPERGVFVSTFDIQEDGVTAEAAFTGFTDDASNPETLTAVYGYGQDLTGAGFMDLGYLADVTEGGVDETVVLRTRWTADGAGRGDMVIFGGDIEPLVFQGSECWGDDFLVSYEENNIDFVMEGDESSCAFGEADWNDEAPES